MQDNYLQEMISDDIDWVVIATPNNTHYQIVKNEDENIQNFELINLYFKRDKMYDFYNKNNIKYSDVSGKILKILPVLFVNDKVFIYDNNFFYDNWTL